MVDAPDVSWADAHELLRNPQSMGGELDPDFADMFLLNDDGRQEQKRPQQV